MRTAAPSSLLAPRAPRRPSALASSLRGPFALLLCVGGLIAIPGCKKGRFKKPQLLGGKRISAAELNRGHRLYEQNCAACHGEQGDGKGPAASTMVPPPRDFTKGFFKYISVGNNGLPTDEDLERSTRRGLPGTRMPAWNGISDKDLHAVIDYLKTFSPRWRKRKQQPPLPQKPDPWANKDGAQKAVARGDEVYHGAAQCWTCHPAYRTRKRLMAAVRAYEVAHGRTAPKPIPVRSDVFKPAIVDTRYGKLEPPDFLRDSLHGGDDDADLYRTVAAGIGGTPMPTWFKRLPVRDLWALVRYVEHLLRLQGTPAARTLQKKLKSARPTPARRETVAAH